MKRGFFYLFLFVLPILTVVVVNETVRPTIKGEGFELGGVKAINTKSLSLEKCSWNCYYETTSHCKKHHTTFLKSYFKYIDPIYFGLIKSMHSAGNYQLMNIIFLVILIPSLIFYLLIKSIEIGYRIKASKQ